MPLILLTTLMALAACEDSTADPLVNNDNAPVLIGEASFPKQLVTVELTPTPDELSRAQTPVATTPAPPTEDPLPLDPTITPTPFVGVFVGTAVDGTPGSAAVIPSSPNLGTGGLGGVSGSGTIGTPQGATGNCPQPIADVFTAAYTANEAITTQLGCPLDVGSTINLVYQSFERGTMYWRDTRQIYALQSGNVLQVVPDVWQESLPASDPGLVPPSPNLQQPVRGFGYAWRNNSGIRDALGWATQSETFVSGYWQNFDNGVMFQRLDNNNIFVLVGTTGGRGTYFGPY